ncbi:MAG: hypothetical protein FWF44_06585 [Defluviitaleaceae bacterium]|nr:hypothetical protein [Defluviitaleaceae bacterium]
MSTIEPASEENTTELIATVKNVEIREIGDSEFGEIYTEEYGDGVIAFYSGILRETISMDDFNSLQTGETIFFRIENVRLNNLEIFIPVVSLRTAEKEMISLSSYNQDRDSGNPSLRRGGIFFISISLLASIHCVLLLSGVNVFRVLTRRKGTGDGGTVSPS